MKKTPSGIDQIFNAFTSSIGEAVKSFEVGGTNHPRASDAELRDIGVIKRSNTGPSYHLGGGTIG